MREARKTPDATPTALARRPTVFGNHLSLGPGAV